MDLKLSYVNVTNTVSSLSEFVLFLAAVFAFIKPIDSQLGNLIRTYIFRYMFQKYEILLIHWDIGHLKLYYRASKIVQTLTLPLLILSSLFFFIFCIRSFLFKSSSTTLKNSSQSDSPLIRSIFSIFDFFRLVPVQHFTSAIFNLSKICSIITIASSSVYGSSSWRRVKLCYMQRAQTATNKHIL